MHDVRQHLAGYHCHSAGGGHLRCVACGTLHSTTSTYDAHTSTKMHKEEVTQMPVWLRRNCGLPVAEGEGGQPAYPLGRTDLSPSSRRGRPRACLPPVDPAPQQPPGCRRHGPRAVFPHDPLISRRAAPIVPNPVSRALFPPGIVDTTDIFDAGTPGMASKARPGPKAGRKPVARHEPEVMEFTEDEDEDGEEGEVGRGEHSPDRDVSFRGCHPAPDGLRILEVIEFSEDEDAEERAFIGDLAIKDREEANNGHEWPGDYPLAFQNKMELTFDMAVALEAAQLADNCGPSGLYSPAPSTGSSTLYDPPSAPAPMGDTGDADPPSLTPSRALSLALAGSTAVGGPSRPALPRPTNSSSILRYSRLADTDEPPAPRATSAKGKGRAEPLSDAEPNEQATGYDAPPFNERDVPPQEPGHNPRPGPVPGEPAFGQADAEPVLPHGDAGSEEDWMEYLFFD
ncbi:hypothetical protein DFJ74DRAFT_764231 [Hyaloraphidium curvatum]|nr:hypothetical protein DFJ74DRAFT_764231 [Hyaloraphidium curvatum]